jgi:hypothetical protein
VAAAPLAGAAFFKTFFLAIQGITVSPQQLNKHQAKKWEMLTSPSEAPSRRDRPAPRHQARP